MSERITCNAEIERRQEYTRRIVKAVNYKGNADHEDVPSILREFQEEIIKELTDKVVEQLEEKNNHYSNMDSMVAIGRRLAYKEAVEIVKKGGNV